MEQRSTKYSVGIDVGGTFTDGIAMGEDENMVYAKTPTTDNIHTGVVNCLQILAQQLQLSIPDLLKHTQLFAHGTTVAVNALVQLRGAKTALITTKGFQHHLYMMKATRAAGLPESEAVDMNRVTRPPMIVPLDLTEEVEERVDYSGEVICQLNEKSAEEAVENLIDKGVESIAVSLLWSFKNPSHEQTVKKIIERKRKGLFVSLSSEVAPVLGEYERTATTAINAYLGPVLRRYAEDLREALFSNGLVSTPLMMQSSGGVIPMSDAPKMAVSTLASGLAGGVIASKYLGELLGFSNIITTDMGGTTFEVGVILDGSPLIRAEAFSPRFGPYMTRYTLQVPTIDLTAIGSGGGSLAWIDEGGMVKVGPRSAGANPGPACYGWGGAEPTVTDADLVLGYLNPDYFLGGKMRLDEHNAKEAVKKLADRLGVDMVEAAAGIYSVANSQAADLIRNATVERGLDPNEFVLFAYGGAGPLHCPGYAKELSQQVVIPSLATVHSAFGVAVSDLQQSYVLSDYMRFPPDLSRFNGNFSKLEKTALEAAAPWHLPPDSLFLIRSIGLRFRAQMNELMVSVPNGTLSEIDAKTLENRFLDTYETRYGSGTAYSEAGLEASTFRVDILGRTWKPSLKKSEQTSSDLSKTKKGYREVYFEEEDRFLRTVIYDGHRLRNGNQIQGPAVVELMGNTIPVAPKSTLTVDPFLNFRLRTGEV
ncbi:MAG: hydantoinase/oxoprolinase family protein [Thaumarchaeota archaeon]|nr:hydantoinase/oxoprolinase family protein [Nitrososphaerota archaeon]